MYRSALNPVVMFRERLIENIQAMSTSSDNKRYLAEAARDYSIEREGYNPQKLIGTLWETDLVITGRPETMHNRIRAAVNNAGSYVLTNLLRDLETSIPSKIESIHVDMNGITELAYFYGNDEAEKHIAAANSKWHEAESYAVKNGISRISTAATQNFDPRKTPGKVRKEASDLGALMIRYKIDAGKVDSEVDSIVKRMYEEAFNILSGITLANVSDESPDNLEGIIDDVHMVLEYGWNTGYNLDRLRQVANRMLEANREWVVADKISSEFKAGVAQELMKVEELGYDDLNERARARGQELMREANRFSKPYRIEEAIKEALRNVESWEIAVQEDSQ